jgi:pyridoxal biosynthesis lyase PdxS
MICFKIEESPDPNSHHEILQSVGVDYIDESEVLTAADEQYHINKASAMRPCC